jgi:hypothetical protein
MLNATGVVYRPNKDKMFDSFVEEEIQKKKGNAPTHNHSLPPKDFMDCDDVDSTDKGSQKSLHDDSSQWSSIKEELVDSNFQTPKNKKLKNGTDAEYTTPAILGASPDVPIQIDDNSTAQSSSSIPLLDLVASRKKELQEANIFDLTDGASDECSFDSLRSICRKAIESGKKEDVGVKRKRNVQLEPSSPFLVDRRGKQLRNPAVVRKGSKNSFKQRVCAWL